LFGGVGVFFKRKRCGPQVLIVFFFFFFLWDASFNG
jgi:cytochrome c1